MKKNISFHENNSAKIALPCSLLSSQAFKESDDFFPGLELVAAEVQCCSEEVVMLRTADEVVAIKQLRLVGEDDAIPCRRTEGLFDPFLLSGNDFRTVRRSRTDEEDVVAVEIGRAHV